MNTLTLLQTTTPHHWLDFHDRPPAGPLTRMRNPQRPWGAGLGGERARYALGETLGEGGMGRVYAARDTHLGREVAIKALHTDMATEIERVRWTRTWHRDAAATARLDHPNIVRLFDATTDDAGRPILVLERLHGRSLAEVIRQDGPLPPHVALELTRQLVSALAHAHTRGVIHRDLKPSNIMLVEEPEASLRVKLIDFGIARIHLSDAEVRQTFDCSRHCLAKVLGAVPSGSGTILYCAPERLLGQADDERGDLWAVGVILHEMLTGQRLFHRLPDVAFKDIPTLEGVGANINAIIHGCLNRDVAERVQSANVLLSIIDNVITRACN